jgi:hypothetical protein
MQGQHITKYIDVIFCSKVGKCLRREKKTASVIKPMRQKQKELRTPKGSAKLFFISLLQHRLLRV